MFSTEINNIITDLKTLEPFKQDAYYLDRDNLDLSGFKGNTDTIKTYAYVEQIKDAQRWIPLNGCYEFRVVQDFKLVASVSCLNLASAFSAIGYQIAKNKGKTTATSQKSYRIWKEEEGSDLTNENIKLIRFFFQIEKKIEFTNCPLICEDGCC